METLNFKAIADFRHQFRKYLKTNERIAKKYGITGAQCQALVALYGYPDREYASPVELSERLQLKQNSTLTLLQRCEKLGLVERFDNPNDHRSKYYRVTEKGLDYLKKITYEYREEIKKTGFLGNYLIDKYTIEGNNF